MDLNYLLRREQVSLMNAQSSPCLESRIAHAELARRYGLLIAQMHYPHRAATPQPRWNEGITAR